jgi:hypothetical protein
LAQARAYPEVVALFVEGLTETTCSINSSKPTQWIVALLDATMILLDPIVQLRITAVCDLFAKRLTNGSRIGVMSVGRHTLGRLSSQVQGGLEEALGRLHIAVFAEHLLDEIALPIDGAVEIRPSACDANGGFITMPRATHLALALGT